MRHRQDVRRQRAQLAVRTIRPWPIVFVVIAEIVAALLSFIIRGDLTSFLGNAILPLAVLIQAARTGPLSLRKSLNLGFSTGIAYALSRVGVTLVQYYAFDWRTLVMEAKGITPSVITFWSVAVVVTTQLVLALARTALSMAIAGGFFAIQSRIRSHR